MNMPHLLYEQLIMFLINAGVRIPQNDDTIYPFILAEKHIHVGFISDAQIPRRKDQCQPKESETLTYPEERGSLTRPKLSWIMHLSNYNEALRLYEEISLPIELGGGAVVVAVAVAENDEWPAGADGDVVIKNRNVFSTRKVKNK